MSPSDGVNTVKSDRWVKEASQGFLVYFLRFHGARSIHLVLYVLFTRGTAAPQRPPGYFIQKASAARCALSCEV